jgi:hypothetical protein
MKKRIVLLSVLLGSSLIMAGGYISPKVSHGNKSVTKACNPNKIYLEKDANLMWEDQVYTNAEAGAYDRHGSTKKVGTHHHAVRYCQRLNYAGYTDWRLPTSDELSNVHNKWDQAFTYYSERDFWSSTPTEFGKYYVVFPADAMRYKRSPRQSNYIRCVRCTAK